MKSEFAIKTSGSKRPWFQICCFFRILVHAALNFEYYPLGAKTYNTRTFTLWSLKARGLNAHARLLLCGLFVGSGHLDPGQVDVEYLGSGCLDSLR